MRAPKTTISGSSPLAAVDWSSRPAVEQFLAAHRFPWLTHGHWVFVFIDPSGSARTVRLRHGLAGHRSPPSFHHVSGGLFVFALHAPMVDRLEYRFEVVDRDRKTHTISDPLNREAAESPFDTKSVALAPGYAAPVYAHAPPNEAVGSLTALKLPGPMGRARQGWLWEPPHTAPHEPLPVILFLDGQDQLRYAGTRQTLENMVHFRAMARCRAYFLKPGRRNNEYSANPETALALGELVPEALAAIRPMPDDPRRRLGVGQSLGGLCLLHTHWTRPGFFGGLLLQSGSYFRPQTDSMERNFAQFGRITQFVSRVMNEPFTRATIPLDLTCGAGEENLANNQAMAEALQQTGFPVTFTESPDAHNWISWRDSMGAGLARLLPPPQEDQHRRHRRTP